MEINRGLEDKIAQQFGFTPENITLFSCYGQLKEYKIQEIILLEGTHGSEIYYLVQGRAEVIKKINPKKFKHYGYINEGNFFGEAGLLEGAATTRTASVRAVVPSKVFSFRKEDFSQLLGGENSLSYKIFCKVMEGMMTKLRERGQEYASLLDKLKSGL